jgi:hypothetical protein
MARLAKRLDPEFVRREVRECKKGKGAIKVQGTAGGW